MVAQPVAVGISDCLRRRLGRLSTVVLAAAFVLTAAPAAFAQGGPPIFSKSFLPSTIAPGGISTLVFSIDNTGSPGVATDLAFTDVLPAGVLIATPASATTDCTRDPSLSAPDGGTTITFSGGSIGAGESCTVSVNVTSSTPGGHVNTSGDLTSSVGNSGPAAATLTVDAGLPAFSKDFSPDPIALGGISTLTFTIDNSGNGALTSSLAFTDTLPAGMVVATPANASTTCIGGTLTAVSGTDVISYIIGAVAGGATCTISVDVTSSVSGLNVNVSGNLTSDLGNSGSATASLFVEFSTAPRPPAFFKSFLPPAIGAGGTSTLQLTIDHNAGGATATALAVTDNLPAGLSVASPANAATTCTGGTLTAAAGAVAVSYTGGSVAAGDTCVVTVAVTAAAPGTYVNTTGDLTSSEGNSGTASDTLTVLALPGFSKSFAPNPVAVGDASALTFTIDNSSGSSGAGSLAFTDNLPAGLVVATPANASTTCSGGTLTASPGTGTVSYMGGAVAAASTCTVSADVVGDSTGSFANTSGDLTSTLGNSSTASDTLVVNGPPLFTKSFGPDTISPGAVSALVFSIDNTFGLSAATGLDFTDNLPAGVVVATPANASTTCTGGTITAASGSGTIAYTGGSVAAGATCAISVDVTSTTSGGHVNTTGDLTSSLGSSGTATATLTVIAPVPALGPLALLLLALMVVMLAVRRLSGRHAT